MNFIHGLHASSCADGWELSGADLMPSGTIVFTEIAYTEGKDYRPWSNFQVIVRLNHSYGDGTIPVQAEYQNFADACGRFVSGSKGNAIWIIGNETNLSVERPPGQVITPKLYADCFVRCERAIHAIHENDLVVPGAVGPWNAETKYEGNEIGDWIVYFQDLFSEIIEVGGKIGAIALHTYTHGSDESLIELNRPMGVPFEHRQYEFQCYREFMAAIPYEFRHLPVFITEANQNDSWVATGWIEKAYEEIDRFNRGNDQQIRAMCLFRYPAHDKYYMIGKEDILAEFGNVVEKQYAWNENGGQMEEWKEVYRNTLELGFIDQDGIGELTIPVGHRVGWDPAQARPEMDMKLSPQPEVYEGTMSAVGFLPYKTFRWWCYTDPILVTPNRKTRASVAVMIVAHGIEGDQAKAGECGMRVGIGGPSEDNADSPNIVWSNWFVVRGTLDNENKWVVLRTEETIPTVDRVRLFVQCNADVAAAISAGHWDLEIVEQYLGQDPLPLPPPPTNGIHTIRTYLDDELIAEGQFTAQIAFSSVQQSLVAKLSNFFKK